VGTSVGDIFLGLKLDPKNNLNKQLDKAGKQAESHIPSAFGGMGKMLTKALSIAAVGAFTKSCLDLGSTLSEVQNVVDVAFGGMADQIDSFAKDAITNFGLSESVAKKYAGTLGSMAKSFGITGQSMVNMSENLTGLTGDIASFYNMSTDEAFTKIKSIFTGETEALKELGVVMTQTALDQYALNNGFGKTTAAMTEQEKVLLRYQFVTSRLSDAQGDFARTSDSWANQTRVLSLRFDALKASIGQGLINVLTPCIKLLNTLLAKLQVVADAFSKFTSAIFGNAGGGGSGKSAIASAANDMSALGDSATDAGKSTVKAAKEIERSLMGFDKINKLSEPSSSDSSGGVGGSGGAGGIGAFNIDSWANGTTKAEQNLDSLKAKIKEFTKDIPKLEFHADWDKMKTNMQTGLSGFFDAIKEFVKTDIIIGIRVANDLDLGRLAEGLTDVFASAGQLAKKISDVVNPALRDFYDYLSPIVKWVGELLTDAIKTCQEYLDDWGDWFTDCGPIIQAFIDSIGRLIGVAWRLLEPLASGIWKAFKLILIGIREQLQLKIQQFMLFYTVMNRVIAGAVNVAIDAFGSLGKKIKSAGGESLQGFLNSFSSLGSRMKSIFSSAWNEVKKVFSADGFIFKGIQDGIFNSFKNVVNSLITGINKVVKTPFEKVNGVLNDIRNTSILGVKPFTGLWKQNPISVPKIPMLAQGAYLAANTPRLAIVGDNKRYGEIIAPEDKLQEMAYMAASASGGGYSKRMVELLEIISRKDLNLDGKKITKAVVDNINSDTKSTGKCPVRV